MIFEFKGNKLSNSLSVFNHYKKTTGRSLESDIRNVKKLTDLIDDPEASESEIERIQNELPFNITEIIQYIYYSMRCAAEKKELDLSSIINEIDIPDLADGSLQSVIQKLVDVKKKEDIQAQKRKFLGFIAK